MLGDPRPRHVPDLPLTALPDLLAVLDPVLEGREAPVLVDVGARAVDADPVPGGLSVEACRECLESLGRVDGRLG